MLVSVTTVAPTIQPYIQTEEATSSLIDLEMTNRVENDTFITITNAITPREPLLTSSTLAPQIKRYFVLQFSII